MGDGSAVKPFGAPPSSTCVSAAETMMSSAALLSRSASSNRVVAVVAPAGTAGSRATSRQRQARRLQLRRAAAGFIERQRHDGAACRDADEIGTSVAVQVAGGHRQQGRGRRRDAGVLERAAAKIDEDLHGAGRVEAGRIGHAFAVEVRPREPMEAAAGAEGLLPREGAVAVVAQHEGVAVDRRDHEIEIAIEIDVGRPARACRRAQRRRVQLRGGGAIGSSPCRVARSLKASPPAPTNTRSVR